MRLPGAGAAAPPPAAPAAPDAIALRLARLRTRLGALFADGVPLRLHPLLADPAVPAAAFSAAAADARAACFALLRLSDLSAAARCRALADALEDEATARRRAGCPARVLQ